MIFLFPSAEQESTFYDRFSHELRTTLTGVIGFSEYIENSVEEPMVGYAAKVINVGGKDLFRITSAYFNFLRVQAGGWCEAVSSFDVAVVVNDLMQQMRDQAHQRAAQLMLNCDDEIWSVRITSDLEMFRQLIGLILHDFINASSDGSLIQIDLQKNGLLDKFCLRFIKRDRTPNLIFLEMSKLFWSKVDFLYEKQDGPGVCSAFAKVFIEALHGQSTAFEVEDEVLCLELIFPLNFSR